MLAFLFKLSSWIFSSEQAECRFHRKEGTLSLNCSRQISCQQ